MLTLKPVVYNIMENNTVVHLTELRTSADDKTFYITYNNEQLHFSKNSNSFELIKLTENIDNKDYLNQFFFDSKEEALDAFSKRVSGDEV